MSPRFSVGDILKDTFRIYFANIVAFSLFAGLILSPALVVSALGTIRGAIDPMAALGYLFGGIALFFLLGPVVTGAITYGVFQQLRNRHASVSDCLATGIRRLLPVLGVSFMAGLAIIAVPLVGVLISSMLGYAAIFLIMIPCGIVALIVAVMLQVAVPCAVIERPGVFGALRRSRELTAGYRWPIFGIMFVLGIINGGLNMLGNVLFMMKPELLAAFETVTTIFHTALSATSAALVYYTLRKLKESIDVEDIASVFD